MRASVLALLATASCTVEGPFDGPAPDRAEPVDDGVRCIDEGVWPGTPVAGVGAIAAGTRIVTRASGTLRIIERNGTLLATARDPWQYADGPQLVGGEDGVYGVATRSVATNDGVIAIERVDLGGAVTRFASLGAPGIVARADADYGADRLAIAWGQSPPQAGTTDLHLALVRRDGSLAATAEILGRDLVPLRVTPAILDDTVWLLWTESAEAGLQLRGARFALADGRRLDLEPIPIIEGITDFAVVRAGARLQLRTASPTGEVEGFSLGRDGTVIPLGAIAGALDHLVGRASGDVLHVTTGAHSVTSFPRSGLVSIASEPDGAVSWFTAYAAEAAVVAIDDDVFLVAAKDALISETVGASTLELSHLAGPGNGLVVELATVPFEQVLQERCIDIDTPYDDSSGCNAAGSAGALPVGAALLLLRRRRRTRRSA